LKIRRLLSLSNALRTETVRAPAKPTRHLAATRIDLNANGGYAFNFNAGND
jgi:hypothetical protein